MNNKSKDILDSFGEIKKKNAHHSVFPLKRFDYILYKLPPESPASN